MELRDALTAFEAAQDDIARYDALVNLYELIREKMPAAKRAKSLANLRKNNAVLA